MIWFEVRPCNNETFSTWESLSSLCINSDTSTSLCKLTNKFHFSLELRILWRKAGGCFAQGCIPRISSCSFKRTRNSNRPISKMYGCACEITMNCIHHEWANGGNEFTERYKNFMQCMLTCQFVV